MKIDPAGPKGRVTDRRRFANKPIYLYRRADSVKPTWFCRVKRPDGPGYVNRSTKTSDEHEAYTFADRLYQQLQNGGVVARKPIGPAVDAYKAAFESQKKRQSIHYKLLLLDRLRPFFEPLSFDELSTATLSQLIDFQLQHARGGKLSTNSIKRSLSDLKHFLNWCVEQGYLQAVPRFPSVPTQAARRPDFNAADWQKLRASMHPYLKGSPRSSLRQRKLMLYYLLVLAETGIRVGEARHLKWRDLRPISDTSGEARIALNVTGKTGFREVIASSTEAKDAFKQLLQLRERDLTDPTADIFGKPAVPLDSYVFCGKDGKPVHSFKKSFASFLRFSGLTKNSFGERHAIYSLRHTYATSRLESDVNHLVLARNMGTSVAMLEQHYGHSSNVSMVDELTKPKRRSHSIHSGTATEPLGWLKASNPRGPDS